MADTFTCPFCREHAERAAASAKEVEDLKKLLEEESARSKHYREEIKEYEDFVDRVALSLRRQIDRMQEVLCHTT